MIKIQQNKLISGCGAYYRKFCLSKVRRKPVVQHPNNSKLLNCQKHLSCGCFELHTNLCHIHILTITGPHERYTCTWTVRFLTAHVRWMITVTKYPTTAEHPGSPSPISTCIWTPSPPSLCQITQQITQRHMHREWINLTDEFPYIVICLDSDHCSDFCS